MNRIVSARRRGCNDLRNVVHAGPNPCTEQVRIGQPNNISKQRQYGNCEAAAQGDKRDRIGHFFLVCIYHSVDRCNSRSTAYRKPRSNEQGERFRDTQARPQPHGAKKRGCHDEQDNDYFTTAQFDDLFGG
jgi:hypothetical protein